jgi:predicted AAA+ superfamily ATPase
MIYPRKLKRKILKYIDDDLVIVVTGMRRVGKTYLLHDIFAGLKTKNKIFLDLEKLENKEIFKEKGYEAIAYDFKALGLNLTEKKPGQPFKKNKKAFIFLDEIQLVRQIPSIIKYFSDHYFVKFVVSGSSSFYLKNLFGESLSGRKIIFNLQPLDFGEFLLFRNLLNQPFINSFNELTAYNTKVTNIKYSPLFEEYLGIGGFPQVVLEADQEKRTSLLKDILNSYLTIDVRNLADFKKIDDLEKLIRILPPRIGQKIDISRFASEIGISRITVKNYLRFLKDTFVINLISPYSKSADREISVRPKLYFCDLGLSRVLADISDGQKLENVVYWHLAKHWEINYYQKKSGAEIDFIAGKKIGFEVKTFATPSDYKKSLNLAKKLGLSRIYILSQKISQPYQSFIMPAFLLGFLA